MMLTMIFRFDAPPLKKETDVHYPRLTPGYEHVDQQILDRIAQYGWAMMIIAPTDQAKTYGFTYSLGIQEYYSVPEVFVFGLPSQENRMIIEGYVERANIVNPLKTTFPCLRLRISSGPAR